MSLLVEVDQLYQLTPAPNNVLSLNIVCTYGFATVNSQSYTNCIHMHVYTDSVKVSTYNFHTERQCIVPKIGIQIKNIGPSVKLLLYSTIPIVRIFDKFRAKDIVQNEYMIEIRTVLPR